MNRIYYIIRLIIWLLRRRDKNLYQLQKDLGYFFRDPSLLDIALTHKSKEPNVSKNYEQLEFLGDAILDQIISELLFWEFPIAREGFLTQRRSTLVQGSYLIKMGEKLDLIKYINAGPSLDLNQSKVSKKQMANVFESLIAAIKLDGGLKPCCSFIERTVWRHRGEAWKNLNYKGLLIEYCQANSLETPRFIVTNTDGTEHEKIFRVAVHIGSFVHSSASAPTKKAAEQAASKKTLENINN